MVNSTVKTLESTYCRCLSCGNIWHEERREPAENHGYHRRRTDVA